MGIQGADARVCWQERWRSIYEQQDPLQVNEEIFPNGSVQKVPAGETLPKL